MGYNFSTLGFMLILISACSNSAYRPSSEKIIPDKNTIRTTKTDNPSYDSLSLDSKIIAQDGKYKIALLVPLAKEKEHIGRPIISAAQLAVDNSNNSDIELLMFDSELIGNDPNLLVQNLREKNIQTILGPLYSAETQTLQKLLANDNITILSLSNDPIISSNKIITLGVSPLTQVDTVIKYAIAKDVSHFYLLLPATKYGKMIEKEISNIASQKINVTFKTNWYGLDNPDKIIDELIVTLNRNDDHRKAAIYMPQAGVNLKFLNNSLLKNKLKIQVIGGQAWDNNSSLAYSGLDGAICLKKNIVSNDFKHSFAKYFNLQASNIDFISYQAISMIANMQAKNLSITKESIVNNNNQISKMSQIAFSNSGDPIYNLPLLEIHNRQFIPVDFKQ